MKGDQISRGRFELWSWVAMVYSLVILGDTVYILAVSIHYGVRIQVQSNLAIAIFRIMISWL